MSHSLVNESEAMTGKQLVQGCYAQWYGWELNPQPQTANIEPTTFPWSHCTVRGVLRRLCDYE